MSTPPVLLCDIGGTNLRLAWFQSGRIGPVTRLKAAAFQSLEEALGAFLDNAQATGPAVISVAGPTEDDRIALTNIDWTVAAEDLKHRFGFTDVRLVNDFAALAHAVPVFGPDDLALVGPDTPGQAGPVLVIGPGTGLGMSIFLPGPHERVIASEGGHVTLPATDEAEARLIARLRRTETHISAEDVVSGPGLLRLFHALASEQKPRRMPETPQDVIDLALSGTCPVCRRTLDHFFAFFGTVAGNAALTAGATGGVLIGGGIIPRPEVLEAFRASSFRERFEAKGRFQEYLSHIPTHVIVRPDPAFPGLARISQRVGGT